MDSSTAALIRVESYEQQLLDLLSKQVRRVPLPVFVCTCMIAGMAWPYVPTSVLVAWLATVVGVLALRWRILGRLHADARRPLEARIRIAVALSALNGSVHGLSLFFSPALPRFECAVVSMVLIGLSAGSVVTTAGHRAVFLAYSLPTLGPLALMWAFGTSFAGSGWLHWVMAAMILVFAGILDAVARDMGRVMRESFDIRMERSALNRDLQQALDVAEAASRAKTRFLASASHDLRQPMQALALFASALAMRPLDERSHEIALHMNTALNDLTSELDALLDVSKLDAKVVTPEPCEIDLQSQLRRICESFRPSAEAKGLELVLTAAAPVYVRTDRKLFERVLRNLIENAIKYTDSGKVHVLVERDGTRACVAITDTGCGIPEEERSHVFEEFYQVNNPERHRSRGLGLGLAIVKRLVELLDISLELQTPPERGTRFVLTLATIPGMTGATTVKGGDDAQFGKLRILVVDDEEEIRIGMRTLLEELGCRVMLASATPEAVALARSGRPDAVIADFRLRGTDTGLKTILAVRAITPAVHAILMTGETAPDRLREAQDANVNVIHKPVAAEVLKQELVRLSGT
jgi:signal transduction histidine kinase